MLFTHDAHEPLRRGDITRTIRVWRRPQAKVGGRYRVGPVLVVVDAMAKVPLGSLDEVDARAAGEADLAALVARLRRHDPELADDDLVWRIDLHTEDLPEDAPLGEHAELSEADVEDLRRRLAAMDARATQGPWTQATLALIGELPGTVSSELAERLGRERAALKADVRKLKRLGLTESLEVGYRLSPRGRALLAHLGD